MDPNKKPDEGYLMYVSSDKIKKQEQEKTESDVVPRHPYQRRKQPSLLKDFLIPVVKDIPLVVGGLVVSLGIVAYGAYCTRTPALRHRVNTMFKLSTAAQFGTASLFIWYLYQKRQEGDKTVTAAPTEG